MTDVAISGFADAKFARVKELFSANISNGDDVGASFSATVEGEKVVDIWGGWRDEGKTLPWDEDTIVNVYSTTKTMAALCTLILADNNQLDFEAPVSRYWPEFGANGKSEIKVRHILAHSSGLSGWAELMVQDDLYDWEKPLHYLPLRRRTGILAQRLDIMRLRRGTSSEKSFGVLLAEQSGPSSGRK